MRTCRLPRLVASPVSLPPLRRLPLRRLLFACLFAGSRLASSPAASSAAVAPRLAGVVLGLAAALLLLALGTPTPVAAQTWGAVEGVVTDAETGATVPGVTILVAGTDYGTATSAEGRYRLRLPTGRYALRFSAVGYAARLDSVTVRRDAVAEQSVALVPAVVEMEGVTVEDDAPRPEAGVYAIDPEDIQNIPSPFKDGFRALKVIPGVATNNELSQQYSVRGGGYNENLVFIDGFEVYMPFRAQQGEQEGLGLLNPDLADRITFYTGGFPARYGGKLSSALDVEYARPEGQVTGAAALSTLDASLSAGSSALDGDLSWIAGARRARPGRFFGTQDTKGDYDPVFTDVQAKVSYRLADGHTLDVLGMYAHHDYDVTPSSRRTYFGILSLDPEIPSDIQALFVDLDGTQRDGFTTRFGGARLTNRLSDRLTASHTLAYFGTVETQQQDITGGAEIYDVDPGSGDLVLTGTNQTEDFADNRIEVNTVTGGGRYRLLASDRVALEGGWTARGLRFDDRIDERSFIYPQDGGTRIIADSLFDQARLASVQAGGYVQATLDLLPTRDRLLVTTGLRTDYYELNGQQTFAPRLSARFLATDALTLNGSLGLYYQQPTYRELRGDPRRGEFILDVINRDLDAQRSLQGVLGGEYFLERYRLYIRAEAYYKHIDDIISYTIDNVRVAYSGENDADGYTYGMDVQLRGEFVPGLESWFNYSYLVARERFRPTFQTGFNEGLVARPADQRHTFSAFVQDYVPGDKTWKLHLRALYGSGFPYTPPVPGDNAPTGSATQVGGARMSERLTAYRRVDTGATKRLTLMDNGLDAPLRLDLTVEILNLFDMDNTVAYSWIPDGEGIWQRVPTRLTPRTFNLRARLTF